VSRTLKDTPRAKKSRTHNRPAKARLMRNATTYACCGDLTTRAMEKRIVARDVATELGN